MMNKGYDILRAGEVISSAPSSISSLSTPTIPGGSGSLGNGPSGGPQPLFDSGKSAQIMGDATAAATVAENTTSNSKLSVNQAVEGSSFGGFDKKFDAGKGKISGATISSADVASPDWSGGGTNHNNLNVTK